MERSDHVNGLKFACGRHPRVQHAARRGSVHEQVADRSVQPQLHTVTFSNVTRTKGSARPIQNRSATGNQRGGRNQHTTYIVGSSGQELRKMALDTRVDTPPKSSPYRMWMILLGVVPLALAAGGLLIWRPAAGASRRPCQTKAATFAMLVMLAVSDADSPEVQRPLRPLEMLQPNASPLVRAPRALFLLLLLRSGLFPRAGGVRVPYGLRGLYDAAEPRLGRAIARHGSPADPVRRGPAAGPRRPGDHL